MKLQPATLKMALRELSLREGQEFTYERVGVGKWRCAVREVSAEGFTYDIIEEMPHVQRHARDGAVEE